MPAVRSPQFNNSLGSMSDAVVIVDKSDSDTGAFTDASTLTAEITNSDTAILTDASTLAATITEADTSSFTETSTALSAAITSPDTASLTDASTISANIASADTATLTDASDLSAEITDADYSPKPQSLFDGVFPPQVIGGTRDLTGSGDSTTYILGTGINPLANGRFTGLRFYIPTTLPDNSEFAVGVFDITSGVGSAVLLQHDLVSLPSSGDANTWKTYNFSAPVDLEANHHYMLAVRTNRYAFNSKEFDGTSYTNGDLRGFASDASGGFPNGAFYDSPSGGAFPCPNSQFNSSFYGIDAVFLSSVESSTVTPTTNISDSDSGSFTETSEIAAALSSSETSTAVESSALTSSVSASETIAGTDNTSEITAETTNSDTSNFIDSSTLTATVSNADTGSTTDASALNVSTTSADTGEFTENNSVSIDAVEISDADTGAFAESSSVNAAVFDSEAISSSDTDSTTSNTSGAETASVADASALSSLLFSSDAGSITEGSIISVQDSDSSSWTDSSSINRQEASLVTITIQHATILIVEISQATKLTINARAVPQLSVLVDG